MASNLQAKLEKNIIFVGDNILNKTLNPRFSYRLNQASATSVSDYLTSLGANISKVLIKGNSVTCITDNFSKADLNEKVINSYSPRVVH